MDYISTKVTMDINEIREKLKKALTPKRYKHSIGVMETCIILAERYGANTEEAALAGLLHDCARNIGEYDSLKLCVKYGIEIDEISALQPELLHGRLGAKLANMEYCVASEEILEAIEYHTVGKPEMTLLQKIVFLADYIEPGREFPEVEELRKAAYDDLDKALLRALDTTIEYVIGKKRLIHMNTISARNWLLMKMGK